MQQALSLALEQATQARAARIHAIRLRVGALSGVVPDALQFAFSALTPGTPAEGAALTIEEVPARFWCPDCGREFPVNDRLGECPDCHQLTTDLRSGRELELTSLEIA